MNLEKTFDAMDEEIVIVNKSGRIVFAIRLMPTKRAVGQGFKKVCV